MKQKTYDPTNQDPISRLAGKLELRAAELAGWTKSSLPVITRILPDSLKAMQSKGGHATALKFAKRKEQNS